MTNGLTRVMIVDDDDIFRSRLKSMLNWTAHGFCICAEAGDGQEAMEMLTKHDPDIVITDIQMPKVGGLDLILHMAENHLQIQTIALSGYDEYNYVRTGMKHGALDYLLKHRITPDVLLEAVQNAGKRIDDRRRQLIAERTLTTQAEIGLSELRRGFMRELLAGNLESEADLEERAKKTGLDMSKSYFALIVAEIDQMNVYKSLYTDAEWLMLFNQIIDMIEHMIGDVCNRECLTSVVMPQPESRFTCLIIIPVGFSFMNFSSHIATCVHNIKVALKKHYNISACYSISTGISSFGDVSIQYQQALVKLESKIYHGQDSVFQENQGSIKAANQNHIRFEAEDEQQIRALLRDGGMDEIQSFVDTLFGKWRDAYAEPGHLQMMFAELLSTLSRVARQMHIDPMELMPESGIYGKVRYMNLDQMKSFFMDGCKALYEQRMQAGDGNCELAQKACSFIKQNYKQSISLADIASSIGFNPSYLSRVFKANTGKTVVEYLNCVRIEAAKRMIEDGALLKNIPSQLGFNSLSYFVTVFRQITGKTPMQYRKTWDK